MRVKQNSHSMAVRYANRYSTVAEPGYASQMESQTNPGTWRAQVLRVKKRQV